MEKAIPLIIFALSEAIKQVPGLASDISRIINKPDVSEADWMELQRRYGGRSYFDVVPESGLRPTPPTP